MIDAGVGTGGNSPATEGVAIGVGVAVVIVLVIIGVVILIVFVSVVRAARSRSYKPDRMPSIDNSPSTSCDGTPDFLSMIDTPDLSRKINGVHELKEMNGSFVARSPFVPSPPVEVSRFTEHVEMFDSNRQLLFQEEYDVSWSVRLCELLDLACGWGTVFLCTCSSYGFSVSIGWGYNL